MAEEHNVPEVKVVPHDPHKFKSKSPEVLAQIIAEASAESGLPREIVYILFSNGWEYSIMENTWSKPSTPEQTDGD